VQGTGVRLSTTATGAARHGPTIACTPTTSLSFVMVVNHLTSTTGVVYAHHITRSKRSKLELGGSNHRVDGGISTNSESRFRNQRPPLHAQIFYWARVFFGSKPRFWRGKCKNSRNLTGHRRAVDGPPESGTAGQDHVAGRSLLLGASDRDRDWLLSKYVKEMPRSGAQERPHDQESGASRAFGARVAQRQYFGDANAYASIRSRRAPAAARRQARGPTIEADACGACGGHGRRRGHALGLGSRLVKRPAAAVGFSA